MPEPAEPTIDQSKADAIHRSILAGFLGNIGTRGEGFDYTGARGVKFNIFPGSGLFKKKPGWVVAAELVETTRLYARTVAAINPQWLERIAAHLVKRTYSEPHWQPETAHVVAFEKVTLYGLVIVPKRAVHYGPIDPAQSRQLFIHHALVEGQYKTSAPFFAHNRQLIEQIQTLEAKARRRDLLADTQSQFGFYDGRIPVAIFNGPLFEQWRRQAERGDSRRLYMSMADLLGNVEAEAPRELYPDELIIGTARLPLRYHLTPGEPTDGVSVELPLALLNQIPSARFEWLVPGLLPEKIEALIRTLPKQLRTRFIPATDVARSAVASLKPGDGGLLDALAMFLARRCGVAITPADFDTAALPEYLRMRLVILGDDGKPIASGRDLGALQAQFGQRAKQTFAEMPRGDWQRDDITRWDFGTLPRQVEVRRHGMALQGFPSVIDQTNSVSLRLLDSLEAADVASTAGVRRLFMLAAHGELKYLAASLPSIDRICLNYATLGKCDGLKADVMVSIAQRAFMENQPLPRSAVEFEQRSRLGWPKMSAAATEIGSALDKMLTVHTALALELAKPAAPAMLPAIADLRQQLAALVYGGFVASTPLKWLLQMPRYLLAAKSRLHKLKNAGLSRDFAALAQVHPLETKYRARAQAQAAAGTSDPELQVYRWMLEELRVSLFAQELKTSMPISVKRIEAQWAKVKS